jgi:hypothetical protein
MKIEAVPKRNPAREPWKTYMSLDIELFN